MTTCEAVGSFPGMSQLELRDVLSIDFVGGHNFWFEARCISCMLKTNNGMRLWRERERKKSRESKIVILSIYFVIAFFFFYLSLELIFNIQKTVDESGNYYVDFLLVFLTCMKNVSM